MNPDDAINASAARITLARGTEMRDARAHHCRRRDCQPQCEMDLINDGRLRQGTRVIDPRVYVCIYGQIHVCSSDKCRDYVGTHEGVCPLTGLYHGHTEGERAYVAPEKRTAHFKRSGTGLGSLQALTQQPDARGGVKRIVEDAADNDEMDLVPVKKEPRLGVAPDPPPSTEPAAAAKRRGNHHNGGARRRAVPMAQRHAEAEIIVTQLLYSNVRQAIVSEKRAALEAEKRRAVRAYYNDRKAVTFPIMVEIEGIRAICDMEVPTMRRLVRNEDRIEHYIRIILRTWEIVTVSPWGKANPGLKFVAHALSVLFKMRKGLTIQGIEFLPFDPYLFHLPLRIDLPLYDPGYNSSMVTEGMKNLESAYRSALETGTPVADLMLHM